MKVPKWIWHAVRAVNIFNKKFTPLSTCLTALPLLELLSEPTKDWCYLLSVNLWPKYLEAPIFIYYIMDVISTSISIANKALCVSNKDPIVYYLSANSIGNTKLCQKFKVLKSRDNNLKYNWCNIKLIQNSNLISISRCLAECLSIIPWKISQHLAAIVWSLHSLYINGLGKVVFVIKC